LQRHFDQEPCTAITYPILVGTDGVERMSKSKGNYVGITESAQSMFGKLMSISDVLMWRYYEMLSNLAEDDIARLRRECEAGRNPRDAKVMLAQEIVTRFHSRADAERALADFEARFRDGAMPEDMQEVTVAAGAQIAQIAKQAGLVDSTSEALRLIAQRGLRVDGDVVTDKALMLRAGTTVVVQAGKRKFARVTVT